MMLFQSSPGFGAGRYPMLLMRPIRSTSFNPRPALGPGATLAHAAIYAPGIGFNPRPALGPGATLRDAADELMFSVSILARLWGRALRGIQDPHLHAEVVSILARLWGRALR